MSETPFAEKDVLWWREPDDSTKYGSSWVDRYAFVKEQGRIRMWLHSKIRWHKGTFLPSWGEEMLRQIQNNVDEALTRVENEVDARASQRII